MLMAVPMSDQSASDESTECSEDEREMEETKRSMEVTTKNTEATESTTAEDDEEDIFPSILGGVVMFAAFALDVAGII